MNTTDQRPAHTGVKPTIVLVHGAYADASSWNGVIGRLQQQGYTVIAPANPLRGVAADSAYTASLLSQIDGPVLLGGHSYGGAVITNAATSPPTSPAWSLSRPSPLMKGKPWAKPRAAPRTAS